MRNRIAPALLAILLAACGENTIATASFDAAHRIDSGAGQESDAATSDDAGSSAEDAGTIEEDAGERPDASELPADAGDLHDAGLPTECAPFETDSETCGACDSGMRQRTCSAAGTWQPWGGCEGEETRYPYRLSGDPVCPPYDRPAVFFSPHPDDESLAMAGAIREHVLAGRDVFVELLTKGKASGVRALLNDGSTCPWHSGTHSYSLTPDEFGEARVREFLQAVTPLGIEGVFVSDFADGALQTSDVNGRIQFWIAHGGQGLSLKGTAGPQDPTSAGGSPHRDHATLWNALIGSGFADVRGYLVSHYVTGAGSPGSTSDISAVCDDKRNSLGSYKIWSPSSGFYGVGYHSVPSLFDAANSDCREFVVYP